VKRLAVGLALGLLLDPGIFAASWWRWAFPWLLLYLLADRAAARGESDARVFLLGAAFSFLYNGAYTKEMHDGFSFGGLSLPGLLSSPLEWGMVAVLWLHLTDAVFPRREPAPFWTLPLAAVTALIGAGVYAMRFAFDHFEGDKLLGAFWPLYDLLFAGAAGAVYKAGPGAAWPLIGAGLWILAARLIAVLPVPSPLQWTLQLAWSGLLGAAGWTTWRDRSAFDDEPRRRDRLILASAALHAASCFFSASPVSLLFDLIGKLLFSYAFLTRRLAV
jgi:hypothetical protein